MQAKTDLRCLALDRASFRTLVAEHPEVAASLLEVALGRLAENAGVGDSYGQGTMGRCSARPSTTSSRS